MSNRRKYRPNAMPSPAVFYSTADLTAIAKARDFIEAESFPCVGAKAALVQDAVTFRVYDEMAEGDTSSLYFDLDEYIKTLSLDDARVQSFVAIFTDERYATEIEFEKDLWDQLGDLAEIDRELDVDWNWKVSDDPTNPHFSMSVAGHPFFVVGLHPKASRAARRAPFPMIVFNSNVQFDKLKADGRYGRMQKVIRAREMEINGSINPMLDDFGNRSEARQYSGRELDESWICPFSGASKPKTAPSKTAAPKTAA